jgi:exosortase family protein XrtM
MYKINRREINFVGFFIAIYIILHSLYYFSKSLGIPLFLQQINTRITSLFINLISPGEATTAVGNAIKSKGFSLTIGWGCEGIEGVFMIIAALAAYSMKTKWKICGVLAGMGILFILNIVRLFFLWYTYRYKPILFDIMHVYIGQTFIIFFAVLFFILWVKHFAHHQISIPR